MCAHALLPWHAHSIHTLCAETRDTPTYAYAHALLARIHVRTCSLTVARAWYTYMVRRDSRHIRICVRTCLASTHSCAHMLSHRGTCIVYIHGAQRLETHPHLRTHMPCQGTSMHTCGHLHAHCIQTSCAQARDTLTCAHVHAVTCMHLCA
jgi:hypothetical protein